MNIFNKIFGKKNDKEDEIVSKENISESVSSDTLFVERFIEGGGKFLYCENKEEVMKYLSNIFNENSWKKAWCRDKELVSNLNVLGFINDKESDVFYTKCEHLIVEDGSILFSSNQLQETKLIHYPVNFIVFATTSQLIHDKDKALTSIKHRFDSKIPSNISAIKDYLPHKKDPNFLNYGNNNSKNLYLLLLEDL